MNKTRSACRRYPKPQDTAPPCCALVPAKVGLAATVDVDVSGKTDLGITVEEPSKTTTP